MTRQSINYSVRSPEGLSHLHILHIFHFFFAKPATSKLPPLISTAHRSSQMVCMSTQLVTWSLARRWQQWHHLKRKEIAIIKSGWRLSRTCPPACCMWRDASARSEGERGPDLKSWSKNSAHCTSALLTAAQTSAEAGSTPWMCINYPILF